MIIESHTHMDDSAFDEDRENLIEEIKNSGIDFLFRTTYDKSKLFDKDIQTVTDFLNVAGHYKVQKCNPVILH